MPTPDPMLVLLELLQRQDACDWRGVAALEREYVEERRELPLLELLLALRPEIACAAAGLYEVAP